MKTQTDLPYYDPAFLICLKEAIKIPELIKQFDRLSNTKLEQTLNARGIIRMIDESTGYQHDQIKEFAKMVHDVIYSTLAPEVLDDLRKQFFSQIQFDQTTDNEIE